MTIVYTDIFDPYIQLQKDILQYFIDKGLPEDCAKAASSDIGELILQSDITPKRVRDAYDAIESNDSPDEPKPGDWLVVVDDSCCTVKLGVGRLYKCQRQSFYHPNCWQVEGICSPYNKEIFRKATPQEIAATGKTP